MSRPKHQDQGLERVLREAEAQGWEVTKRPRRYFKMRCSCAEKHFKMVHLTPSSQNYERNLRAQLSRHTCWKEAQ